MLAAIPLLLAWPSGQGIGGELAGSTGRIQTDGPGQSHLLLGRTRMTEPTQGPVETSGARRG